MSHKKPMWDGKSRVSNDNYRKRFNEIFKQTKKVIYKQSKINKEEPNDKKIK